MALADEIEELAEEHRQAGSRKPYTDAEIDFYELEYAGEKNPPDFQKWRKTIKKSRLQGRRELRQYRQRLQKWELRQLRQQLQKQNRGRK
jgi:hypothetical protein